MARNDPSKEASLREVLAEVSLADLGPMFKRGLATMGCWVLFAMVILVITALTENAGYGLSDFGIPDWLIWLPIAWATVHVGTSEKSFHQWNMEWYFPKLNWLGSLLFATYLLGFIYLLIWVNDLPEGIERGAAFLLVWFGYGGPFLVFSSITSAGHGKLMEKRRALHCDRTSSPSR